jgi:MoxR-like ATPase
MTVTGSLRNPPGGRPAMLRGLTPEINGQLRDAFTPTRPKQRLNALFVGRRPTLERIIEAIEYERAHVILFGDRGRGKTSLANAVEQRAGEAGYLALKLTCSAELGFVDVFRHFLRRIPSTYFRGSSGNPFAVRRPAATLDELLPDREFSVAELHEILAGIAGTHVLMILDEYDRVTDERFRNELAELIKNTSDSGVAVTLLVVGVAEDLDQLIGMHPSIRRALVPVHLPLMTDEEVAQLIHAGAHNAGLTFVPDVERRIVAFARGLPYCAQLLGLHAARSAVSRGVTTVEVADLAYAVTRGLQEAERGIVEAYSRLVNGEGRTQLEDVVYAAALCPSDEFGAFDPAVLVGDGGPERMSSVSKALERLTQGGDASVLRVEVDAGGLRYRFRNQMMRQYVLMRQARERGRI